MRNASARVDDLTGHEQLGGLLTPDELRESTESRRVTHEPTQHEQLAELRLLGRDPEVGHERELHAPPDGRAVHRGDDGDVGVQQRVGGGREHGACARASSMSGGSLSTAHHDLDVVA